MPIKMKLSPWILLIAGGVLPAAHAQVAASQTGDPLLNVQCNDALYRFLPGEVNYCLARKMWGKGNHRQAEELLLLAAGWGSKPAQYALGIAYFNGEGVAKDRPLGLAWLALSTERDNPTYAGVLSGAYAAASVEERDRAEALYAKLREQYRDDVAAVRAKKRYDREISAMAGNPVYRPRLCIAGLNSAPMEMDMELFDQGCQPVERVVETLNTMSEHYFEGWRSRVDVGPLQKVRGPAARPNAPASPDDVDP